MSRTRSWTLVVVTGALGLAGAEALNGQGVLAGRPECPHDWDFKEGQIPLVGSDINVPELHDCQRFIRFRDERFIYDSLYAIWASRSLVNLDEQLPVASSEREAVALAVAEIYAEGNYPELGISSRFSCLYLGRYRAPGDSVVWTARMVPVRDENYDCRGQQKLVELRAGAVLQVRRQPPLRGLGRQDYPIAARWDWDVSRREQYIGVSCGAGWCEIGRPGFGASGMPWPTASAQATPVLSPRARRTRQVKAWYDQQFLAVGSPANPSVLMGTIYPDSSLDDRNPTDFQKGWVPVAHVALEVLGPNPGPAQAQYKRSLNLDVTPDGSRLNTMFLCEGDLHYCLRSAVPALPDAQLAAEAQRLVAACGHDANWWGMIEAADGSRSFRCVVHRSHRHLVLYQKRDFPGTVRWRWSAADETTWDWCPMGCCEMQGMQ